MNPRLTRVAADAGRRTDGLLLGDFLSGRSEPAFAALVDRHGPMAIGTAI